MRQHILATVVGLAIVAASSMAFGELKLGVKVEKRGDHMVLVNPVITELAEYKGAIVQPKPPMTVAAGFHPLSAPESVDDFEVLSTMRITRQLGPSSVLVRHYGTGTGEFDTYVSTKPSSFSDEVWTAIDLAPDWIRLELIANLSLLPTELQEELGALINDAEDPRYMDEIAFLIANITAVDLTNEKFRARYVSDQARAVYDAEPMLGYVSLVEYGEPGQGDYYTTTKYRYLKEGKELEYELPREYYYWWIVHTRLDGEELFDVRPDTGKFDEYAAGLGYKEYYLFPPEGTAPYMTHYVFKDPPVWEIEDGLKEIPFASLNDWGPSARGAFVDYAVGPSNLTFDSTGRPTTIEFKIRPKGVILATTLLVEKGYAEGKSDLLETMLRYGPGNAISQKKHKHVVLMDNNAPFGHEGVIEGVLEKFEVNYEVITSGDLAECDLTDVRKMIVPSDQPLAVYQAIADNRTKLEDWLKPQWSILEIHGAVSTPEQDWSGLVMPGDFTVEGVADQDDDLVEVEGQPPLAKLIANTKYLWDFEKYPGLSGDRLFDPDTFALDKIGWWSSQNVWDSVIDFSEKHPWLPIPERTIQANRVLYNHYGNCGENQDIITAASRSVLVPVANCGNGPEDHVWSEYFIEGDWHTYQMGWADAPTDIDTPGISSGKKWGGGKNNSFITQVRGDGALINRTDYYHYTGKLDLTVVDAVGEPIKGAIVVVFTESYYKGSDGTYPLTPAFWDYTDGDGKLTVELGANVEEPMSNCNDQEVEYRCNNYYVRVLTEFGGFPGGDNNVSLVVDMMEAIPDFHKKVQIQVPVQMPRREPAAVLETTDGNLDRALLVTVDTLKELACGYSLYAGTYCEPFGEGRLDLFLLDLPNVNKLMLTLEKEKTEAEGEVWEGPEPGPFDALAKVEGLVEGGQFVVNPPYFGDWYFVLVQQSQFRHHMLVDLKLQVLENTAPAVEPTVEMEADIITVTDEFSGANDTVTIPPDDAEHIVEESDGDDGCAAGSNPAPASTLLLLLILLVGLLPRVKRGEGR